MKKLFTGIFILVFLAVSASFTSAQDDAPKAKYMVWEVKLSPVQLDKTLEAIKFQHDFLKSENYPYAGFVQYTNDGILYYSNSFLEYSEIDKMNATDKALWEGNPEKGKEVREKFKDSYKTVGSIILVMEPEMSVLPPQSAIPTTGKQFRLFEKFYIKQGKGEEFAELTKKYKALREKHGITEPFYTFYPEFGPDMSIVYFIDEMGDNPADHYKKSDQKWEKFGEEGKQLWEDVKPLIEKMESHMGWADYDISYTPSK